MAAVGGHLPFADCTKTLSRNGVLDESVRKTTDSKRFSGAQMSKRVWVIMSFVLEESCSLYAYSLSKHLNKANRKPWVGKATARPSLVRRLELSCFC